MINKHTNSKKGEQMNYINFSFIDTTIDDTIQYKVDIQFHKKSWDGVVEGVARAGQPVVTGDIKEWLGTAVEHGTLIHIYYGDKMYLLSPANWQRELEAYLKSDKYDKDRSTEVIYNILFHIAKKLSAEAKTLVASTAQSDSKPVEEYSEEKNQAQQQNNSDNSIPKEISVRHTEKAGDGSIDVLLKLEIDPEKFDKYKKDDTFRNFSKSLASKKFVCKFAELVATKATLTTIIDTGYYEGNSSVSFSNGFDNFEAKLSSVILATTALNDEGAKDISHLLVQKIREELRLYPLWIEKKESPKSELVGIPSFELKLDSKLSIVFENVKVDGSLLDFYLKSNASGWYFDYAINKGLLQSLKIRAYDDSAKGAVEISGKISLKDIYNAVLKLCNIYYDSKKASDCHVIFGQSAFLESFRKAFNEAAFTTEPEVTEKEYLISKLDEMFQWNEKCLELLHRMNLERINKPLVVRASEAHRKAKDSYFNLLAALRELDC